MIDCRCKMYKTDFIVLQQKRREEIGWEAERSGETSEC